MFSGKIWIEKGLIEQIMEGSGVVVQHRGLKVDVAEGALPEMVGSGAATAGSNGGGLARQGSTSKNSCLCSPTTHAGSFRCRLHRAPPSLQRTKSIDSTTTATAAVQDSQSKPGY